MMTSRASQELLADHNKKLHKIDWLSVGMVILLIHSGRGQAAVATRCC